MELPIRQSLARDKIWLLVSWLGVSLIYLSLVWKTTADIDQIITDCLFSAAIAWLLWHKTSRWHCRYPAVASFLGLFLLSLTLIKTFTLFSFESTLIFLLPISAAIALILLVSGFKGFGQYVTEIFLTWFLFFPTGVIGHFLNRTFQITVVYAKIATYLLYYLGFQVATQNNEVMLNLPQIGQFRAIVNYSCAGIPMLLLLLKLALIVVACGKLETKQKLFLPLLALGYGCGLGVIRVCLLTLVIREPSWFDYWHGDPGTQIFSTIGVVGFAIFGQWTLNHRQNLTDNQISTAKINPQVSDNSRTLLPVKIPSVSLQWRNYFLIASAVSLNLLAVYAWTIPIPFSNFEIANFDFPPRLELNSGTVAIASTYPSVILPLSEPPRKDLINKEVRVAYQQYQLPNSRSPIDIGISYIINTRGEVNNYLQQYTSLTPEIIASQTNKNLSKVGYHILFTDQNRAYLNSCISPRSPSNINHQQFSQNRYHNDLDFNIAWKWLRGTASIRDRRCLWVNISTPINSDTQTAYQQLETAWKDLYQWWLSNFPAL